MKLLNLLCSSTEVDAQIELKEKSIGKSKESFENISANIGYPIALGKIGGLPGGAITSRCIMIRMQPETEEERDAQMRERKKPLSKRRIRDKVRVWLKPLQHAYTKAPKGTPSRTEDIWQPLLAVAKLAGPKWVERAFAAMASLEVPHEAVEPKEVQFLRRVALATRDRKEKGITAVELDRKLGVENPTQRGIWMREVGLKSRKRIWRKGEAQVPGYELAAIREAAKRHGVSDLSGVFGVPQET